ncbi:MAG TPA: MFS transporter [Candidatus Ruania gallistercoris]|uniref:MFS transporter n=1 Tax=Candidatus Ruania gallistercoris TaxID=2838746 RepID=A0A9D2EBB2_9MICO|nr:MFS transporter [Candidatus Ruania gallistercoris]
MRDLLRRATFRRLLGGWSIGNLADSALFLTLAVWAKDLTGSSAAAGMVFFALGAPALLVPLLGLLVDRVRRKSLMVVANLVAALAAASLVFVTDASMLWLLYAVTVVYGALGILNGAALSGLLRDLLPDEQLDQANAALSTVDQGLRIFTPMLGAGLYVLWGGRALGLGVAILLVVTAIVLTSVRATESRPEAEAEAFWTQTVAGFRHLRSVPVLWRIVTVVAVGFGVVGLFDTVLFEVVEHGLGMPPAFFGVLMTVQGAGAILGGLTSARMLRRWGPQRAVGLSQATLGLAALLCAGSVLGSALLPVVLAALFAGGMVIPWMVVAMVTTRQRLTPPRLQGRTAAAANLATTVPQIASIAAGAGLVALVDYRILLLVACAVLVTCGIVLLRAARLAPVEQAAPMEEVAAAEV